ncbi:MAG TPA: TIGR01777 family oxidoreductase [Bryobacteraceae bacterium]|nr:TIGR01777 family oxidoreductase [Bryobacteraceae bacterium]
MNYLITGATGFIGRHLVALLLARGDSVNYLGRQRSRSMDSRAAFHCWNPGEMPPLSSVPRLDAVINLAGEPIAQRWSDEVKQRIYTSRVDRTRQLVSAIAGLKYKPRVLVSASAVGYYGDRGDEVLTENSTAGSDFLAKVCVDWEREAMQARESGVRVVTVRIATVLGRDGGALKQMLIPFRLGLGGRFGNGRQWMSWIHVQDLARLLAYAADDESVSGALNGSSPEPVTNAQFTKALAHAVHRPAILPVPKFALKLALGEAAGFLLQSLRVMPEGTMQGGFRFDYPQLAEALGQIL